jgi:hypothetical protein
LAAISCGLSLFAARSEVDGKLWNAGVQVRDVLIGEPDAARGHEGPDRRRLIGAVDAVNRLTEIKRERAPERISR